MREYLRRGLLSSSLYHIMTGAGLILFSAIGKPSPIAAVSTQDTCCAAQFDQLLCACFKWRYLLFLCLFASELYLLLAPSPSTSPPSTFVDAATSHTTILDVVFPKRIVYQHILLLHQVFFFLSVALSRVAPVLFPSLMQGDPIMDQQIVRAMAERLGALAKNTERECKWAITFLGTSIKFWYTPIFLLTLVSIMLDTELLAIHETPMVTSELSTLPRPRELLKSDIMHTLTMEMEDVAVENKLKSEVGPVKTAWDFAVDKEMKKRVQGRRLQEIAHRLPSPPPETGQGKIHIRARSLSL